MGLADGARVGGGDEGTADEAVAGGVGNGEAELTGLGDVEDFHSSFCRGRGE